jgi:predicted transcriptional regulator
MARKGEVKKGDPVLEELEAIKRLLVVALIKNGATQGEIANALGHTQGWVSQNFSWVTKSTSQPETTKPA